MSEANDPKLKLAMAKLLPEKIRIESKHFGGWDNVFIWIETGKEILETEWLYVMHLVEKTLTYQQMQEYVARLHSKLRTTNMVLTNENQFNCINADFNSKATAMCKVKGITL